MSTMSVGDRCRPASDRYGSVYGKGIDAQRRSSFYGRSLVGRSIDINILEHTDHIKQSLDTSLPMTFPAKHTSPSEILFIINKLPKNKSPGHDLITNLIIKNLPKRQ